MGSLFVTAWIVAVAIRQGEWSGVVVATLIVACTATVVWTHPYNWMMLELILGSKYRLMPVHTGTARVIAIHHTSSCEETRKKIRQANAGWPYGGWYATGERFVVLEIEYESTIYRTCMQIDKTMYACLQTGQNIPVTFQFARGLEPAKDVPLARIKTA